MRTIVAAIFSLVWRAILLGTVCVLGFHGAVSAQVDDDQVTANGEVRGDRPEPAARPRGPNRERLTLDREAELGLSPGYTFVGLGITAALGGVMVWSLVNTLEASDRYKASPTRERYEEGRDKVRRTWLLGAACSVTGLATLLIAILGTEWGDDEDGLSLRPAAGPEGGSLTLRGRF